ncbi:uncharacterized protein PV09_08050 [Verruconis gallopava]|uniref:Uncharacterized protein n=1 Tax=Verruconis gallopava TaxID=253628 RepID=A0A0D1YHK6_9PEZI|nr:uncharacterized protein PV09_08050 [Verruconis gallopava]KIW00337.1 hypothetical protein PV09_08050 [Verruconis gallopava]
MDISSGSISRGKSFLPAETDHTVTRAHAESNDMCSEPIHGDSATDVDEECGKPSSIPVEIDAHLETEIIEEDAGTWQATCQSIPANTRLPLRDDLSQLPYSLAIATDSVEYCTTKDISHIPQATVLSTEIAPDFHASVATMESNDCKLPVCGASADYERHRTVNIADINDTHQNETLGPSREPSPTFYEFQIDHDERAQTISYDRPSSENQYFEQREVTEAFDEYQRSVEDGVESIGSCSEPSVRRSLRARHPLEQVQTPQELNKRRASKDKRKVHQKRTKTEDSPKTQRLTLLKEMEDVDQDIINPQDIYQQFLDRSSGVDEDAVRILVRLFYAIASPQAFDQLKDVCTLIRTEGEVVILQKTDTAAQTINALNALDTAATVHSILRRFHLVRLLEHRTERERQHESEKPQRRAKKSKLPRMKGLRTYQNSSSLALADLMAEAYPHLDKPARIRDAAGTEYGKRHSSLKHMLVAGRNWHALQQAFPLGILALIPTGRECGIQNSDIERLHASVFDGFLDILTELRGDFIREVSTTVSLHLTDILFRRDLQWKYRFETVDAQTLRSHRLDAPVLVELCGTD